jgi:hypothetical protein
MTGARDGQIAESASLICSEERRSDEKDVALHPQVCRQVNGPSQGLAMRRYAGVAASGACRRSQRSWGPSKRDDFNGAQSFRAAMSGRQNGMQGHWKNAIKCENIFSRYSHINGLFGSKSDILNPRWLLTLVPLLVTRTPGASTHSPPDARGSRRGHLLLSLSVRRW